MKEFGVKLGRQLDFLPDHIGGDVKITDDEILHLPVLILYDEVM